MHGIHEVLQAISPPEGRATSLKSFLAFIEVPVEHCCSRPYEQVFQSVRNDFFLPQIHALSSPGMTSFAVKRDIFLAFFGHTKL